MYVCVWTFTGQRQCNGAAPVPRSNSVGAVPAERMRSTWFRHTNACSTRVSVSGLGTKHPMIYYQSGAPKTLGCRTNRRWGRAGKVGRSNVPVDQARTGSRICADLLGRGLVNSRVCDIEHELKIKTRQSSVVPQPAGYRRVEALINHRPVVVADQPDVRAPVVRLQTPSHLR